MRVSGEGHEIVLACLVKITDGSQKGHRLCTVLGERISHTGKVHCAGQACTRHVHLGLGEVAFGWQGQLS